MFCSLIIDFLNASVIREKQVSDIYKTHYPIKVIRPWDQTNLVFNSTERVKPGFLLSLMCIFLNIMG